MELVPDEHKEAIVKRVGRLARCPGDGKEVCVFKLSSTAGQPIYISRKNVASSATIKS